MKQYENDKFFYIMLGLACFNPFSKGSVIVLLFCIYNAFALKIYIDFRAVMLMLMSIFMVIPILAFGDSNKLFELAKVLNYSFPYLIGYNVYLVSQDKEKVISNSLFSMYIGYSIYVIFIYFYNLYLGFNKRTLMDIWGDGTIAATLASLLCTYVSSYSIAVLFYSKKVWMKIFSAFNLLVVILLNSQSGTRSAFVIILIIFVLMFLSSLKECDFLKVIKRFSGFLLLIGLICVIYSNDLFGMKNFVLESNIFNRFADEGLETGRFDISRMYFERMFKYPFGGEFVHKEVGEFAHNVWQECYDKYGIFSTICLIYITGSLLCLLINVFKINDKSPLDFIVINIYCGILIQLALEPILSGYPILLWGLLFIHGLVFCYYKNRASKSKI